MRSPCSLPIGRCNCRHAPACRAGANVVRQPRWRYRWRASAAPLADRLQTRTRMNRAGRAPPALARPAQRRDVNELTCPDRHAAGRATPAAPRSAAARRAKRLRRVRQSIAADFAVRRGELGGGAPAARWQWTSEQDCSGRGAARALCSRHIQRMVGAVWRRLRSSCRGQRRRYLLRGLKPQPSGGSRFHKRVSRTDNHAMQNPRSWVRSILDPPRIVSDQILIPVSQVVGVRSRIKSFSSYVRCDGEAQHRIVAITNHALSNNGHWFVKQIQALMNEQFRKPSTVRRSLIRNADESWRLAFDGRVIAGSMPVRSGGANQISLKKSRGKTRVSNSLKLSEHGGTTLRPRHASGHSKLGRLTGPDGDALRRTDRWSRSSGPNGLLQTGDRYVEESGSMKYVGIDLGTTNSAFARSTAKSSAHKSPEQHESTPSAIFIDRAAISTSSSRST